MTNFAENRHSENYLYPAAFKLTLSKIPGVVYFCQSVNIPTVTVSEITTNNPKSGRTLKIPSQNLQFGDLTVKFLIEESMNNWLEIYNWMQSLRVVDDWQTMRHFAARSTGNDYQITDGALTVLTSANNPIKVFKLYNIFPKELSAVDFNSGTDGSEAISATAVFALEYFTVETP